MYTLATLFKQLADSAASNDSVTFRSVAERLFKNIDEKYPELLEQDDSDFLDAYAQIVDYQASGTFTIEKEEAVALIGKLALREDMKEKSCEPNDSQDSGDVAVP